MPPELSLGSRVSAAVDQSLDEIVPVCPLESVALAEVNDTLPKFDSGSAVQLVAPLWHCDGASATHSAVETSGLLIVSVLLKDCPVVWLMIVSVTSWPFTVVVAVMWSPGRTARSTRTGALGTSSYQA